MPEDSRFKQTLPQLVLFVVLMALLSLAEFAPARFERAMQEDGWAEWATFSSFLLAALVATQELVRSLRGNDRSLTSPVWLTRLSFLGLALFCLFVAGEEISWGQRLLGFRPPALFLENNFQQESNLHNLLKGIFDTRWMVFLVCAVYGVLLPYAAYVTRLPRLLAAPIALMPWYAAVAWLELAYPYELVGELAEMMLGLLFLIDVLERQERETDQAGSPAVRSTLALATALVLAVACLPLNDVSLRANTAELVAHTEHDLASLAERMATGETLRSSLFRKQEVHKRLYTAVKAGYLELPRERFFLDAWNSPYWISFERAPDKSEGKGRVLLYSFGPNRRRELDLGRAHAEGVTQAGDDVAIVVEVALPARASR